MTTIGSIGVGLFILIILWILALIIFVIGVKFQNNLAWIALGVAATFTGFLLVIPTENPNKIQVEQTTEKNYDFIYRILFLIFILLSALIALVFLFLLHCIEPVRLKPVKSF